MAQLAQETSPLKALLQGTLILTISNITLKAINFFLLPLYTSYLTPDQLGINDTIINFTSLVYTLLVMAFDSAYSAFYYDEANEEHRLRVLSTVWFALLLTSTIAIVCMLFANDLSLLLFRSADYAIAIRLSLAGVILNLLWLPFSLDLRVRSKMVPYSIVTILSAVVMIALNILFVAFFQLGFYALIASTLVTQALQLVLYFLACGKRPSPSRFSRGLFVPMLKYALPMIPSALAFWVLQLSSTYIILAVSGPSEVGIYGVAARCSTAVNMVGSAFFMSYTAYAFQKANSDENAPRTFAVILSVFFIIFAVICLIGSLFGKEVIGIMASPEYQSASILLPGLLLGQMFYSLAQIIGYGISIAKKSIFHSISAFVAAAVSLGLNLLLVPHFGALGAACTSTIAYIVMLIFVSTFSQRLYPCPYEFKKVAAASVGLVALVILYFEMPLPLRALACVGGTALLLALFRSSLVQAKSALSDMIGARKKS